MKIRHDWLLFIGALTIIGALYNHYLGHSVLLFELILLAAGVALGLISAKSRIEGDGIDQDKGLIARFLSRWMEEKTIGTFVPLSGLALLAAWSLWKVLSAGQTNLRMEDFIVTIFSLSLILYQSAPIKLHEQRDFVILYLMFLTIIFAGMWKLYTLVTGESYGRITAYSEYYFITIPVVSLVNLFGIDAQAVLNLSGIGLSNIIEYEYEGHLVRLGIGSGCSGLYSAGLFFSAFLAFVLVRYQTVNVRIVVGLAAGLAFTWLSNILRMVVTIVVGSEFGVPALATFHMYFGIIIFMCFVVVFWYILMRWLDGHMEERLRAIAARSSAVPESASSGSTSEASSENDAPAVNGSSEE